MHDRIVKLGKGSIIQHGKYNDRIYLMKLSPNDVPEITDTIQQIAVEYNYSKIFGKVPSRFAPYFISKGYLTEAIIPGFFKGKENAFFMSKFLNSDRLLDLESAEMEILSNILQQLPEKVITEKKNKSLFKIHRLQKEDVPELTELYKKVFDSYPFPIHNPDYILETMKSDVQYYGIRIQNKLVAASSAETDRDDQNAELTDFATDNQYRGKRLSTILLKTMEKSMKKEGIRTVYTIARSKSPAMNKTFLRDGYQYGGTLIKNTNISGSIESMNVHYKAM